MTTGEPTLRDLMQRLDAFEQRIDQLVEENHASRSALARSSDDPSTTHTTHAATPASPIERLSRRWVLRRGMQVAAASVAAGVVAHQTAPRAHAENFESVHTQYLGADVLDLYHASEFPDRSTLVARSHRNNPTIDVDNGIGAALMATSGTANGAIEARANNGIGVAGVGRHGVTGRSSHGSGNGVLGNNPENVGVLGEGLVGVRGTTTATGYAAIHGWHKGNEGTGVAGDGKGAGAGVLGRSPGGDGVRGEGAIGVRGKASATDQAGVYGEHASSGPGGVVGDGRGAGDRGSGDATPLVMASLVMAGPVYLAGHPSRTTARSTACIPTPAAEWWVMALASDSRVCSVGTRAVRRCAAKGRSGCMPSRRRLRMGMGWSSKAARRSLRIMPAATAGKPTSGVHAKGEIILDSAAAVWICTVAGTPGTWRKVSTTVA